MILELKMSQEISKYLTHNVRKKNYTNIFPFLYNITLCSFSPQKKSIGLLWVILYLSFFPNSPYQVPGLVQHRQRRTRLQGLGAHTGARVGWEWGDIGWYKYKMVVYVEMYIYIYMIYVYIYMIYVYDIWNGMIWYDVIWYAHCNNVAFLIAHLRGVCLDGFTLYLLQDGDIYRKMTGKWI